MISTKQQLRKYVTFSKWTSSAGYKSLNFPNIKVEQPEHVASNESDMEQNKHDVEG